MRALALCAALLGMASCKDNVLVCHADTECLGGNGEFGLCLESRCAFRDNACTGNYRWDDSAGALAGKCVEPATIAGHLDGGVADGAASADGG